MDSGPFTEKPHQFWDKKNEEIKKQKGKHEYVLTQDEVDKYNETDIQTTVRAFKNFFSKNQKKLAQMGLP